MPIRTTRSSAASRAEARRRARLAARDGTAEPVEEQADAPEPETRTGLLSRVFPPAPPLGGRPDPLRHFDAAGPMRPLRERLYLLRQNPWAWIPAGVIAALGFYASIFYRGDVLGLLATFVQFGALIAAGWFGWQRPTLYGSAAGVLSGLLTAILVLAQYVGMGVVPTTLGGPGAVVLDSAVTVLYQGAFGFIGGWYGGYLRRRQAQLSASARRR